MCYETVLTMLTYGNWYYPDEDPLAKRRKTNKTDSNKAKEQTSQTTGSNNMTLPNKPLLTVRRLVGDRLSMPKNSKKNSAQAGYVFRNVGREANNPYCVQGYSVVDPALMFGVRDVRNVWPGRMQIPNEPPRYECRPSAIARPYPLRFRPVFSSFPNPLAHPGWVRASVSSAFTPVRHISPEFQTSIVTTQPVMTEHSSSIQSLSQMVSAVRTGTSTSFTPARIPSSRSSKCQVSKPTAQPITTANPSSSQSQESRVKPSLIPVEKTMFSTSSSFRGTSQTTCSVTTSEATFLPENLSVNRDFNTARSTSAGSSTSHTSIVTTKPIIVAHPSSIQSPSSVVGSVTDSTTTLSPVDLSANSARMISFESSQSEDSKPITTAFSPYLQLQESPKFNPSHSPVQTSMFSPSSSFRGTSQTTCSVTTSDATFLPEDLSVNRDFGTVRSTSAGSSTSQTSIVTTQPIIVAHPYSIQSPSSVVGSVTDSTKTLLPVDLSANSARMTSSESSQSEDFKPIPQLITTTPPTSLQPQESPKFKPSYIPVKTIKFSPSSSLQTATATTSLAEEFSANSPFSTAQIISSESQESLTFQPPHIPVQTIMYSPSSSLRAANQSFNSVPATALKTSLDEEHSANSAFSTVRIKSSGSPVSQTSIVTTQSVMNGHSPSIQTQESPKFQPSYIPVQTIMYSPPSSFRAANQSFCCTTTNTTTTVITSSNEELSANSTFNNRIISSGLSKSQAVKPNAQPIRTADPSSSQPQESPKFQFSHIPVQTIKFSPSCRAASQNACSVTTSDTTLLREDLSVSRASSTARSISTGSSTSQTSIANTQPVMAAHSSSMVGSVTDFTTTSSPVDLSTNSSRMTSSESSQSEDSKPITTAFSSSLQLQELSKYQCSQLPPERNTISSPPSFQPEESSKSPISVPTTQSITTVPPVSPNSQSSKLTTHLLLLSKPQSSEPSTSQTSKPTTQPNSIAPSSSLQSSESTTTKASKITTHLLLLSQPPSTQSSESSTSQTSKPTTQPTNVTPPTSLQSSESTTTQNSKRTTHLLLLSPPHSIQSSELSTPQTSKSSTQPITAASSCSTDSTTTQAPQLTTHLLLLSKPQPLQSSESLQSQNAPITKLLLISPPISQVVSTATTPTTASPAVASSGIGGESLSEVALDLEEAVVQSVVGAIKVDIPRTSQKTIKRKEDEIEEKDALLQRIYSVPAFGGKTVKGAKFYQEMLTKPKLCHLFKCMGSDCSFTCNQKTLFDQHIELHEAKQETQNETSKDPSEEDDEPYDWQQCAYCCESPIYPTISLSEHVITEHGYCEYQCAYCFYRALFQNYVDIHQTLAHRKILKNKPRLIFKCKTFSEGPTVENALKKTGRRRCVRPYHCDQCGSEFLITEEFMNHLLKEHQSVTSYTCHICKNVCFKADRLVVHYKLHSYSTYQCAYCLHGTETERKMIFHLCTLHFAQPACLYVRAWEDGKQIQSEDKSKKPKNRSKFTNQLDSLKMISYDIEATRGESTLEEASDEDSIDDDRLVIDESQELNDIIAELGITTETESSEATTPLLKEFPSIGNSTTQNVSVSTLLPNAKFSLEAETESETVLISSGSSSNSSSN